MAMRKRQRPSSDDVRGGGEPLGLQSHEPAHASEDTSQPGQTLLPPNGHDQEATLNPPHSKQIRKTQSWYSSWPRPPKASASTSVAKENIHGGTYRSRKRPDLSKFDPRGVGDTVDVHSKPSASAAASLRAKASMSQLDGGREADVRNDLPESTMRKDNTKQVLEDTNSSSTAQQEEPATADQDQNVPPPSTSTQPQPLGWLDWLAERAPTNLTHFVQKEQPESARPATPPEQNSETVQPAQSEPHPVPTTTWFGLWAATTEQAMAADSEKPAQAEVANVEEDTPMNDAPTEPIATQESPPKAGSTWAFWSRAAPTEKLAPQGKGDKPTQSEGEIAVFGQGSEAHPLPMNEDNVSPDPKNSLKEKGKTKTSILTWGRSKRSRAVYTDETASSSAASSELSFREADDSKLDQTELGTKKSAPKLEDSSKSIAESEISAKQTPNLVLPSFSSTYCMMENPSILQQITRFLLRTSQPPANHVFRVQETPKIRHALAIGVHGLFPATYLRAMIGQPTGTSLRFANLCADGIRRWADAHGCADCEIEKVALEGEGRISDRVDNLWKLLLNWIEQIRRADLIIIASHSQGVPVSLILLEKLINLGIVTNAKIGVCAMAGVALGPFPDYRSNFLIGSAAELWDFGNPQSANSQRFESALKCVLDYGARVTLIGSIDDQVVPMESAVYSPASHPYIYRAVFIDGRIHAPDFIAHLVGFALKLRNLGVSDHGLVRELSLALAGSLYSGEGHSRIYYDASVYDLAIAHALETTSVPRQTSCHIEHRAVPMAAPAGGGSSGSGSGSAALASANPYVLPWIMRGLLEEDFVKTELSSETEELLRQFDEWKPSSKALKDVKYRLEAIRSKL